MTSSPTQLLQRFQLPRYLGSFQNLKTESKHDQICDVRAVSYFRNIFPEVSLKNPYILLQGLFFKPANGWLMSTLPALTASLMRWCVTFLSGSTPTPCSTLGPTLAMTGFTCWTKYTIVQLIIFIKNKLAFLALL